MFDEQSMSRLNCTDAQAHLDLRFRMYHKGFFPTLHIIWDAVFVLSFYSGILTFTTLWAYL